MQPALRLPGSLLEFRELDDFHPDHIYRTAEVFQKLAEMRSHPPRPSAPVSPAPSRPLFGLLDDMIDEAEERSSPPTVEAAGDLAAFIDRVAAPHLEQKPDAGERQWAARVDEAASEQMRSILHHPDFQALEAAWRAVWMLVQGLGAEEGLQIHILDATLPELTGAPEAAARL